MGVGVVNGFCFGWSLFVFILVHVCSSLVVVVCNVGVGVFQVWATCCVRCGFLSWLVWEAGGLACAVLLKFLFFQFFLR